jgi:hypothetical protein
MAAGRPAVRIRGATELRRALGHMDDGVKDFTQIGRDAADIVAVFARGITPRMDGTLRQSIRTRASKTRSSVAAGRKSVPYAGVIHFGWPRHNIEPQPFLYDALDRRSDEVIKLYEDRVTDLVHKLDRETPG